MLCAAEFDRVELLGLFHARKLRVHELALRLGWDRVHRALRMTGPFYDRFTPAIAAERLRAAAGGRGVSTARSTSWPSAGRDAARAAERPGALALVLHTHMPYVEGFGTWPFGEEWLWEAVATSYLPLLDVLAGDRRRSRCRSPRCCAISSRRRGRSSAAWPSCARSGRSPTRGTSRALRRARRGRTGRPSSSARRRSTRAGDAVRVAARGRSCWPRSARYAGWTSAATHAVLPLLATDRGVALQLETGIASHRRRFGGWRGGLWLPECGHAAWLDPLLERAGVRATASS